MAFLVNSNEFTSIGDLGDLALKIVEQESTNVKVEDTAETVIQIDELQKDTNKVNDIDFDAMEFEEGLDYLREHEPKAYGGLVVAFCATSLFCVGLMHYILSTPPRDC